MRRTGLAILLAVVLSGCAAQRPATVGAPSTTAVRDQIHAAASSARSANDAVSASAEGNKKIKGALQQIDDKLEVIDRWEETHRKP